MDGTKSVLLYPGRWGGFDLREAQALSQTILTETKFDVFICTQAHPLTTKDNVHEQNPIITGVGMYGVVKEVIFFNGVVGLGEDFLGQVHFSFPHNEHLFLLLRMRLGVKSVPPGTTAPPTPTPLTDMFVPITTYQPKKYNPPPLPTSSASQVCEDYFVASFVKGDKKTLGVFRKAGINYRLIPDIYRSWANYDIYRIYSSETKLSQESLKDLLSSPGFTGRGLMDGNLAETPCSPENKLRIIRMASLEGFGKVEHRGGPLTVLQLVSLTKSYPSLTGTTKFSYSPGSRTPCWRKSLSTTTRDSKTTTSTPFLQALQPDTFTPHLPSTPAALSPVFRSDLVRRLSLNTPLSVSPFQRCLVGL